MNIFPENKKRVVILLGVFCAAFIVFVFVFIFVNSNYFNKQNGKCNKEVIINPDGSILCRRGAYCELQNCDDLFKK